MWDKFRVRWVTITTLVLSITASATYRMGGASGYPRFIRELGSVICMIGIMLSLGLWNLGIIPSAGAMYGLETTYFKKKGEDATLFNWILVGFAFGISMLPWALWCAFFAHRSHWLGFGLRTAFTTGTVPFWQCYLSAKVAIKIKVGKDVSDEVGRGFINAVSLPLLLI